jgi:hypothetical protein
VAAQYLSHLMANALKLVDFSCLGQLYGTGQHSGIGQFCGIETTWGSLAEALDAISFFGQLSCK